MAEQGPRFSSARFREALIHAAQLHAAQPRKGTDIPYVAHHLGVRLELPAGEVSIFAKVVRFEQPPEGGDETGYLLGLRIRSPA